LKEPEKKCALIIRGPGTGLENCLARTVNALRLHHGYDYIEVIEPKGSSGFDGKEYTDHWRFSDKLIGHVADYSGNLTEDDTFLTLFFGHTYMKEGVLYIPTSGAKHEEGVSAIELQNALAKLPVDTGIDLAMTEENAGVLARILATTRHSDLGARHIAVSSYSPEHGTRSIPARRLFREALLSGVRYNSLEQRFSAAAAITRDRTGCKVPAYLGYAQRLPTHYTGAFSP